MEDNNKTLVDKIEELIVGGQKEVIGRLVGIEGRLVGLEDGQKEIVRTIKAVHSSLKNEIKVTATAVKDDLDTRVKKLEAVSR